MAISTAAVFAALRADGSTGGADVRYGVKRSKRETADGGAVDARLRTAPDGFSADAYAAAARHGVDVSLSAPDGRYVRNFARSGIVGEYAVRGLVGGDDALLTPPAPPPETPPVSDPAPADATATDPVPARNGRGRKPVNA